MQLLRHREESLVELGYNRFLRTLTNKTRLSIIQALRERSKNVTELTQELEIHQTSVSHGLRRLLDCGFVFVDKRGKERLYSLNNKTIKPLIVLMDKHVNTYCKKLCGKND